jgi:hypothetical protein
LGVFGPTNPPHHQTGTEAGERGMNITKSQIERWNITDRQNREAKLEERRWRIGLKKKEDAKAEETAKIAEEWELERVTVTCLIFKSKIFRGV